MPDDPSDKPAPRPGAPPCGLWLTVGPALAMVELVRDLRQVFFVVNNRSAYERNMHTVCVREGNGEDPEFREKAAALFELARANGFASILHGDAAAAKSLGADGVLVDAPDALAPARGIFGADGIIGLHCKTSADLAARAHDAGADFIVFGTGGPALPGPEPLRFWRLLTDKPAVIEGPVTNDYCAYFVQAGAGFIDGTDYIWSHGKGILQATSNFLHAIELATADGAKQ